MIFNKQKTVYMLNGYAPEKLWYVSNRHHKKDIKIIPMNNFGDVSNKANFDWLINNRILDKKSNYVLITSEIQLEYIKNTDYVYNWFSEHYNNILITKTTNDTTKSNPIILSDKRIISTKLHDICTQHTKIMLGKDFNKLSNEEKYKYVAKSPLGTGSSGIIAFSKGYPIKTLKDDEEYIIEQNILRTKPEEHTYEPLVLVTWNRKKNKAEVSFSSHECDSNIKFDAGPIADNYWQNEMYYWEMKDCLEKIVNKLNIKTGLIEPEFIYNDKTKEFRLMDLNARWSGDHSLMMCISKNVLPKDFDILYYYLNNKPFYKTVERKMKKHLVGNKVKPARCYVNIGD